MAKNKNIPQENEAPTGQLFVQSLETVLNTSMLPYAEFVILDRALPRVEDGLKPVQRRILYAMNEMGLTPDKPHRKSAGIVGECLGKYHPHGDTSVYDAMVRMAQDFNMGKTLVDGHGNFGSVDGDPAAAMRYTEARLEPLAMELLRDIDKETVPFSLNFDDRLKEPDILPGRFPNLLVNGSSGIAVGLATNIPTHNLGEVIDGVVAYIDNPAISLEEMMQIIPAPDFPTGGIIIANELIQAYKTGRGKITLRAKVHLEEASNGRTNIVITEFPYQVNKAMLLAKIADLRSQKKELEGIDGLADESDRTGMRAVIRVKKDTDVKELLQCLFKATDLEITFGINMVVIADGKPQQLGLLDIIRHYVEYQRKVVYNRTVFDLNEAQARAHVLEGLIVAVRNIDEVIAIIKSAESTSDAKAKLCERFSLSDIQAQAILDLRLARLTKLEVYKLENELEEVKKQIKKLTAISKSKEKQFEVVKEEISQIKTKYPTPRKSKLVYDSDEADKLLSLGVQKPAGVACTLAVMANDKIKVLTDKQAEALHKELDGKFKPHAVAKLLLSTKTDEQILAFTNYGNCHLVDIYDPILNQKLSDEGVEFSKLSKNAEDGEKIVAMFAVGNKYPLGNLILFTKLGMVKKTDWSEYESAKKSYYPAIKLGENDELIGVEQETDEEDTLLVVTKHGSCINAKKDGMNAQGRVAIGYTAIKLDDDDEVIFAMQTNSEGELVVATSEGRFKRVITSQIKVTNRNTKGAMAVSLADDEKIVMVSYVTEPYYILAVSKSGVVEIPTEDIPIAIQSSRARTIHNFEEKVMQKAYPLFYRPYDE